MEIIDLDHLGDVGTAPIDLDHLGDAPEEVTWPEAKPEQVDIMPVTEKEKPARDFLPTVEDITTDIASKTDRFVAGAKGTALGMKQTVFDVAELAGVDMSEATDENMKNIGTINEYLDKKAEESGTVDDFLNSEDLGRLAPLIATLPATMESAIITMLGEGVLGYAESRGKGQEKGEALTTGVMTGVGAVVVAKALPLLKDFAFTPGMKKTINSWSDADKEVQKTLYKFMEDNNLQPFDAMIEGSTSSDIGSFLSGGNLFAVKEAVESSTEFSSKYLQMTETVLGKLKANRIDLADASSKQMKQATRIVKGEVEKLRKAYKDIEHDLYSDVTKQAENNTDLYPVQDFFTGVERKLADENIPPEAVDAARKIMTRFKKPYKADTIKLKAKQGDLNDLTGKQVILQRKIDSATTEDEISKLLGQKQDLQVKWDTLNGEMNELKDIRYMDTKAILGTIKLLNRKMYSPGGAISVKDLDEMRGLQIAKEELTGFLEQRVKDPKLKESLKKAKDATKARIGIFGAKDMGGEKPFLAKLIGEGDMTKASKYLEGKDATENVQYVRDIFGKDSEAYRGALSHYTNNKLGITPDMLPRLMQGGKASGITDQIDVQKVQEQLLNMTARDYNMLDEVIGKTAGNQMRGLKHIVEGMSGLENAAEKYGKGITYMGVPKYIMEGTPEVKSGPIRRGMKAAKDALGFHMSKTLTSIIGNQPKFRALTGGITGEALYLATTDQEDITAEGMLAAALFGGVSGKYAGRATRNIFEKDVQKLQRYLNKPIKGKMPQDIQNMFISIGNKMKDFGGKQP